MAMGIRHIVAALRHYGRLQAITHGQSLHCHLIKTGFSHNVYAANNLMSMYIDFVSLNDARNLFDEIPQRNIVTWTTLVAAYTGQGQPLEAIELYTQMLGSESEAPNGFMSSVVLKACGLVGDVRLGRMVHERISEEDMRNDVVLMNTLLDMYVKCGNLKEARRVFDAFLKVANATSWNTLISGYCKEGLMEEAVSLFAQMPEPNVVSWNSIVAGFANNRSLHALDFVCKMHQKGLKLDDFAVPCALKTCGFVGLLDNGRQIHCIVIKSGIISSCFILSALIDMYADCNGISEAKMLFDQHSGGNSSFFNGLVIWNSMLSGYVVNGENRAAVNILLQMTKSNASVDSYTLSSALKVCINLANLNLGIQVHGFIVTCGCELDFFVGSIVVELYAKLGKIKDAFVLFHRLPKKDTVAWSSLIMRCAEMGFNSLALSLCRDMVNSDIEVDGFVISNVLKVCSNSAALKSGKQFHAFCIKSGFEMDGVTITALIDMYSKGGEIDSSLALFDGVSDRDVVCWTAIIVGCGQNGRAKEAVEFFQEMTGSGLKPNEVTFLGVLAACRHAGLVEKARTIFKSMKYDCGLEPQLEHYYCLVDLLGQAGHLSEAVKLIAKMPFEPDKTIWSSMLYACATYRNIKMANKIAKYLLATAPDDPSIYVMLSNAYATLGQWDSLIEVREAAKQLGIKEAGMSWIEIPG